MDEDLIANGRVLIVDDDSLVRMTAAEMIESLGLVARQASSGAEALVEVLQDPPDLILLDIMMPGMSGFEVCRQLKSDPLTSFIPVIVVTGRGDESDVIRAFDCGANEYVTKPFKPAVMQARIKNFLKFKRMQDELQNYRKDLEAKVNEQTRIIREVQNVTVFGLAKLAECRDPETGKHLERLRHYSKLIACNLAKSGHFTDVIDEAYIDSIYRSSVLHDIGKVGIEDSILLKPGRLTEGEFATMKQHTIIGGEALGEALRQLSEEQFREQFLDMARSIAFHHHERYDGKGYPFGLAGEQIPLCGRIVAVADVYDALTSRRPYKEPFPIEEALGIMIQGRGTQFDATVLDSFLSDTEDAKEIGGRFAESGPPSASQAAMAARRVIHNSPGK